MQNRLRWHLHELEPGYEIAAGALDRKVMLDRIAERLQAHQGLVAEIAGQLVEDIRERTVRVNSLERRIGGLMADLAPSLLLLEGCGGLTAAKIVGETADVSRFRSRGAYAMQNGTAPIPIWSGNRQRFRLNRGGNRQLDVAMHRIAVTQIRLHRSRPHLPGPADGRRRHQDHSAACAPPEDLRRGLPPALERSSRPLRPSGGGSGLTYLT